MQIMKNSTIKKIEIDPQNPVSLPNWGIIRDKYTTVLQMKARLANTKNLCAEVGRGAGKSTEIFAERFVRISYDMPGSLILLAAPTYVFILDTILPALTTYLAANYTRGLHYHMAFNHQSILKYHTSKLKNTIIRSHLPGAQLYSLSASIVPNLPLVKMRCTYSATKPFG